jgi:hypothetical protein
VKRQSALYKLAITILVYGIEYGTGTIDPASINATTRGSATFTLTGAATTDIIIVNPPADLNDDLIFCGAAITAADTVTIYLYNPTGSAINDTARTFSYVWIDTTANNMKAQILKSMIVRWSQTCGWRHSRC